MLKNYFLWLSDLKFEKNNIIKTGFQVQKAAKSTRLKFSFQVQVGLHVPTAVSDLTMSAQTTILQSATNQVTTL